MAPRKKNRRAPYRAPIAPAPVSTPAADIPAPPADAPSPGVCSACEALRIELKGLLERVLTLESRVDALSTAPLPSSANKPERDQVPAPEYIANAPIDGEGPPFGA
jgi:hypothetical protein